MGVEAFPTEFFRLVALSRGLSDINIKLHGYISFISFNNSVNFKEFLLIHK